MEIVLGGLHEIAHLTMLVTVCGLKQVFSQCKLSWLLSAKPFSWVQGLLFALGLYIYIYILKFFGHVVQHMGS